jgi:nucleoside-diphosphate-sugar epimerase
MYRAADAASIRTSQDSQMKILITGNMGYVGPSVVRQLRAAYPRATLIGLDMGYFSHCLTNAVVLPECYVDVQYFADVRAVPQQVLSGVDAVVHLAAISNDTMGNTFGDVTMEINYRASVELAQKAKQAGAKSFVFASSCSIYGFTEDGLRSEASSVNPLTTYAKSKVLAERDLARLADPHFRVTSLRFATACGMSERLRLDLVLNDFIAAAVASKKIAVLSDGTPWRPLLHVKDMARACDWAISRGGDANGDFLVVNAGSNEWNYQVRDLAEAVARVIPNVEVSINRQAQPDKRSYRVDFSLFKRLAPDHQPKMDLVTTIAELQSGLEAMRFQNADFRNSHFMRLRVLQGFRARRLLTERLEWTDKKLERAPSLARVSGGPTDAAIAQGIH